MPSEIHAYTTNNVKHTQKKVKEKNNLINDMQEPLFEWMSVFLNSREIHNSLFTMRASKNQSQEVVSHTYSKHLFFFSFFFIKVRVQL